MPKKDDDDQISYLVPRRPRDSKKIFNNLLVTRGTGKEKKLRPTLCATKERKACGRDSSDDCITREDEEKACLSPIQVLFLGGVIPSELFLEHFRLQNSRENLELTNHVKRIWADDSGYVTR